jgi:hypothetical protein
MALDVCSSNTRRIIVAMVLLLQGLLVTEIPIVGQTNCKVQQMSPRCMVGRGTLFCAKGDVMSDRQYQIGTIPIQNGIIVKHFSHVLLHGWHNGINSTSQSWISTMVIVIVRQDTTKSASENLS